jgi:hypothetical protein
MLNKWKGRNKMPVRNIYEKGVRMPMPPSKQKKCPWCGFVISWDGTSGGFGRAAMKHYHEAHKDKMCASMEKGRVIRAANRTGAKANIQHPPFRESGPLSGEEWLWKAVHLLQDRIAQIEKGTDKIPEEQHDIAEAVLEAQKIKVFSDAIRRVSIPEASYSWHIECPDCFWELMGEGSVNWYQLQGQIGQHVRATNHHTYILGVKQ